MNFYQISILIMFTFRSWALWMFQLLMVESAPAVKRTFPFESVAIVVMAPWLID